MFSAFANLAQPATIGPAPKNVPPPTPVRLPQCNPQLSDSAYSLDQKKYSSLVRFLQSLHRPTEVSESHFAALGVHVHVNAPAEDVVPDSPCLPSTSGWDNIDLDEAKRRDQSFRTPLSNGRLSPEARVYLERRSELSVANQTAFRTVRRIKPEVGTQPVRLGNCYEFFKQMELMATFWDDTSLAPLSRDDRHDHQASPLQPSHSHSIDPSLEQVEHTATAASSEPNAGAETEPETKKTTTPERVTYRTAPGSQMPAEFRHGLVSALVKLVAYDFGCSVAPPRVEPRLYLIEPPSVKTKHDHSSAPRNPSPAIPRASYFSSGCIFLHRTPTTREAARGGIVEGPIAAVSARNTTNFLTPTDSYIDFGRELIAALVTAQLRAREGKVEKRFGEDKWWATAKRWGGGEGGPIGREVEGDSVVGDKDATGSGSNSEGAPPSGDLQSLTDNSVTQEPDKPHVIPFRGPPMNKKPRKTLSMYDRYRMVRLPSSNWDKKARYEAIGKVKGADYDDVFVISSLFHHVSVLRVRVPNRLLQVMEGAAEEDLAGKEGEGNRRSWGKLEIWRSKWFDMFLVEDRLEAMRLLWGMMAWTMRKTEGQDDAVMKNA
ncbi:hypothetical protein F5Y19DRAFT_465783 [Xylariaceae sp. FL1651]|nr:hypothetical protein F5Y19DRAFT_465783 [Xylariaceae sp. FL1651]